MLRSFLPDYDEKLDNHFTHPVFWILHELDMIEP